MRLFLVKNGKGLEFTVSADRCADISRLSFRGINMGYFSPNGYVAPSYYDDKDIGFLKSFTAGFLTTCGLAAVGVPCEDEGEQLPLHGTVSNTPVEYIYFEKNCEEIKVHALINDEQIFSHKLLLRREIICSLKENIITIKDYVENRGDKDYPLMILYHMNIGYPLLSEKTLIYIPSDEVQPRNDHAEKDIGNWNKIISPTIGFEEQCYFHHFSKKGLAAVYNSDIDQGLLISFDKNNLNCFTEWKMMGERDYVLGLEPGNCHPDGRNKMRQEGNLKILKPYESISYEVTISMLAGIKEWEKVIS
nr:aldose 1-epimerase family protein [Pectinatus haikarae]